MRLSRSDVPPVYALTDASRIGPRQDLIQELITAGVRWIQVREKSIPDIEFYEVVHWAVASLPAKVKLFVNDRLDIALACTADGVHLGEHDLPVEVARRVAGEQEFLIGRSTHSAEDGIAAGSNPDVDYVAIGPIFRSQTKNVRDPLGIDVIRQIREQTEKPIVAIGGIDETNIASVLEAGADTAAVISVLYRDGTVAENVRRLCDAAGRQ